MKYPTPSIFKNIFEDSDDFNEETNRWLEQIALQSEFGRLVLKFVLEGLKKGEFIVPQNFPIPKAIHTEDGYKFTLSNNLQEFQANGDLTIELEEVLKLMSLTCLDRAEDIFPYFSVKEWASHPFPN